VNQFINIFHSEEDIGAEDFDNEIWQNTEAVEISRYWSGAGASPERTALAGLIWTDAALLVRFDCSQHEPFVVNPHPQVEQKTNGLWEQDVCEIFVAPDSSRPERYFEFEVAPTGEWLDLGIHQLPAGRETDFTYNSGMKTAARIVRNSFTVILRVEWNAFGKKPESGDAWRGNLFRCVGSGETRGYLAWQPTLTEKPNFHVPAAFGWLRFNR
jgi:alpha-galactosidase